VVIKDSPACVCVCVLQPRSPIRGASMS
jgi:hypothetical protein